ncbi:Ras- protein Rab-27A [Cichlidogyrus casuarinus]|uniref:Ras- protein Rab-27A n=1 Tax=Cichlidogyrus casuarinus TaxID=1844966 RepID=A0ABD2Q408_9PLAT
MSIYKKIEHAPEDEYDYLIKLLALGMRKFSFHVIPSYLYTDDVFNERYSSTVGVDFKQKRVLRETKDQDGLLGQAQRLHLQLWDTAGQERYRSLCKVFFRDSMGFLLVFDLTNEKSLINCREWMQILRENAYCDTPDVVLVGNKADLTGERTVTAGMANILAKELNVPYIETSSATGLNVKEAVHLLLDSVMTRIEDSIFTGQLQPQGANDRDRVNLDKKKASNCNC